MEEVKEEVVELDIDWEDRGNPQAVTDYVEDIYAFYRNTEVRSGAFLGLGVMSSMAMHTIMAITRSQPHSSPSSCYAVMNEMAFH